MKQIAYLLFTGLVTLFTGTVADEWEALLPSALAQEVNFDQAARAYRVLSVSLNTGGRAPSGLDSIGGQTGPEDAVWAYVFAARTFAVARRLLTRYPLVPGGLVELGAGWGPFACAGALAGARQVALWELGARGARAAAWLSDAFSETRFQHIARDARHYRPAGPAENLAVPYSLREIFGGDVSAATRAVRAWWDELAPRGRIYLVAAGDKQNAQFLQQVRDGLPSEVIAGPCMGVASCPRLPKDWCHMTWRMPLGAIGRRIAASASRKAHELHVSWLVLGPTAKASRAMHTVLEVRPQKHRVEVSTCGPEGEAKWVALKKHSAFDRLLALEPGTTAIARGESRGDGLRLVDEADLELVDSWPSPR